MEISLKYWNGLKDFERIYIQQYAEAHGISKLKMVISDARKQVPDYVDFYGLYCIVDPAGQKYKWSGDMTRKFIKVV